MFLEAFVWSLDTETEKYDSEKFQVRKIKRELNS